MIDSIIYYGAGTKAGTLATAIGDFGVPLRRFLRNQADENGVTRAMIDGSVAFPIDIVTQRPVVSVPVTPTGDDNPGAVIVTPRTTLAGFALWVATEDQAVADLLWALPLKLCRVQLDRDTAKIIRTNVPLATLRTLWPEPVPAGSAYDWPNIA